MQLVNYIAKDFIIKYALPSDRENYLVVTKIPLLPANWPQQLLWATVQN